MQKFVFTLISCLILLSQSYSQTDFAPPSGNDKLLYQLEWQLKTGNSRYLRDIASFLDSKVTRQHALEILANKTIFPSSQVVINKQLSKKDFFDFYYQHKNEIKFSHILQMYYTVPLEQIKRDIKSTTFEALSPMDSFSKLCLNLQNEKNILKKRTYLISLKYLQLHKGVPINKILHCLDIEDPSIQQGLIEYNAIQYLVGNEELASTLQNIFQVKDLDTKLANTLYNMLFESGNNLMPKSKIDEEYKLFMDGKVTLKDSIKNAIENKYKVSDKFYYNDVDFYGTTLCTKTKPQDDTRILIANLMDTKDPKLLFYLAAYVYISKNDVLKRDIIKLLENLTLIKVSDKKGLERSKDILIYWAQHYHEYAWEDSEWRFVSENQKIAQIKNLERLIRRLNSKNDTIAIQAYTALTEAHPHELNKLINKYKKVMKKTNSKIPPLKYNYLEVTTQFVTYNKEFEINHKLSPTLQKIMNQLEEDINEMERFQIENKVLHIAQVKDIPALEYWGILHVANRKNSFTTGRIVEKLYAKYWSKMSKDRQWLTHFIYKASLFNQFDGSGIAKSYEKLLNLENQELKKSIEFIREHSSRAVVISYIDEEILNADPNAKTDFEKAYDAKADLVKKMKNSTEIKYSQINQILDFDESLTSEKEQTISFIKKLSPLKDIRKLAIKEKLSTTELEFLKGKPFTHREVGSVMRFFNDEDPKANLDFALEAIKDFNLDDQAYVVNRLFRYQWFRNYIYTTKSFSQQLSQVINILSSYLKESEFIGEIEDRTTQINIIQLSFIGRTIEEQLVTSIELDVDLALKADLQKTILAKSKFEDLGVILDHVDGLVNNKGNLDLSFLNQDFGIPIFDIATNAQLQTFLERHKSLTVKDFYKIYLQEFGLEFTDSNGNIDFNKIAKILKYDIIQPFIGKGGGNRDFYVYGLTKVLEEVFNENLGFQDKLNNYQTFVSFSSLNRAKAWYEFLVRKGYGKSTIASPSFK